jgi:hypothetical protein
MTGMTDAAEHRPPPSGTAFADLPADCFPFTVELLDHATRDVLWSQAVGAPGAVRVPPAAELGAERVAARVTFADGTVQDAE